MQRRSSSDRRSEAQGSPNSLAETIGPDRLQRYRAALLRLEHSERDAVVARIELAQSWQRVATLLGETSVARARARVGSALKSLATTSGRPAESSRLPELADAVANRSTVQWEEQLRQTSSADERTAVEQLRLVDSIASTCWNATLLSSTVTVSRALTSSEPSGIPIGPDRILGQRYRLGSMLGRGGMGEVWQAHDLKLRVDVALKRLHPKLHQDQHALELLRREVRSARRVGSPNVCRIHDLEEIDGHEYVTMEYIDGTTLVDVLRSRGPLRLRETMEMASQFLAGLEAIHDAGLIHRDIKPENIMITRSGRVVLMDFGLAKPLTHDATATIAGTPAYMPPEQIRGGQLDARTDVFAAGVVLAEMIGGEGPYDPVSRKQILDGVRQDPAQLPDSRWRPVLLRALAKESADRWRSARALLHALEKTTLSVEGSEELRPYPGLASFTQTDAEFFFGRELEVETLWKRLQQPGLLGVIGPSGAGKSSFLRAGLIPAMPEGWRAVLCHPGDAPLAALAQSLVDEFAGDTEAMRGLVAFNDPEAVVETFARWRNRHRETLLIVDQFEELFTLCSPEIQARFAEVLGRLALEADVHVLLALRDDFLMHCHEHQALKPMFSELTALDPPTGAALRRAVVQPALLCGYRFEDEALVEEMLEQVGRERGALPLLAFALARLWQHRDRDKGQLTRDAYERTGGVGAALAQHAEATLERIGSQRLPMVRELFRNLVTPQGTRAAREVDELLSIFDETDPAEQMLNELIDARLLTSFEKRVDDEGEPEEIRYVEIIHESLLTAWPRLVRWRTQDAESAQTREQLRQAAQVWKERGGSDDLLWTGTAFQEFEVWRERYPGGLTATEESFAHAMTQKAKQRSRRRRIAFVAVFASLLVVLAVVSVLWRQSERSRQEAIAEARRAEAAQLHSLAQLELDDFPTAAVAYALRSLELADNPEVRRFAIRALWRGPTAIRFTDRQMVWQAGFTPDGSWLLASIYPADPNESQLRLWSASGGSAAHVLALPHPEPPALPETSFTLGPRSDRVATYPVLRGNAVRLWSIPELLPIRELRFAGAPRPFFDPSGERLIVVENRSTGYEWRSWPIDGGESALLGRLEMQTTEWEPNFREFCDVDPNGDRVAFAVDGSLFVAPLDGLGRIPARRIGDHSEPIYGVAFDSTGRRIASTEISGKILEWDAESGAVRTLPGHASFRHRYGAGGTLLANNTSRGYELWDLTGPPDAEPITLRLPASGEQFNAVSFHPGGHWLATGNGGGFVWPLARAYPRILRGHSREVIELAVSSDGEYLVSSSFDGTVRRWPLTPSTEEKAQVLYSNTSGTDFVDSLAFDPETRNVLASHKTNVLRVIPMRGGLARELDCAQVDGKVPVQPPAMDRRGRYAVWLKETTLRIWDAESGEVRDLGSADPGTIMVTEVVSGPADRVLVASGGNLRRFDVEKGTSQLMMERTGDRGIVRFDLSPDGRHLLACEGGIGEVDGCAGSAIYRDLESGETSRLTSHGDVYTVALDPSGRIAVTASPDGIVRVGPATGDAPHLLIGHVGGVRSVTVLPDGRWVATAGNDHTVRLWPMPEGRPLHALPYDELLERLRAVTNLRIVGDPRSPTGYRVDADEFPGWEALPTW